MTAGRSALFTIGYERAAVADFIRTLADVGVEVVVDVRKIAGSRRREFCKSALADALDQAGIVYRHCPALGTPKAGRDAAKAGNRAQFLAVLEAQLSSPAARADLSALAALARARPTALLCLERDPARCHRTVVAGRIVAETGQRLEALFVESRARGARRPDPRQIALL